MLPSMEEDAVKDLSISPDPEDIIKDIPIVTTPTPERGKSVYQQPTQQPTTHNHRHTTENKSNH